MPEGLQRRDVLRTTGLVLLSGGAVLTLAGCGAEGQAGNPVPTSAAPSTAPSSAPSSASSTPSASSARSSATKPPGTTPSGPSVTIADVPVGGGVVLPDADFVVTQPTKGTYKAFSAICTHRQCKVADVADGTINCNCHGSKYSIKDGSVVNPPAPKPLAESKTAVVGSKVFVTG
jgi:Rieske Fe-S protein